MVEAEVSSNSSSQTLRLRPELAPLPLSSCLSKRLVTNDVAVRNLKIEGLKTPPSRGPFLMAVGFALDFHLLVNPMPLFGPRCLPGIRFRYHVSHRCVGGGALQTFGVHLRLF